MLEIHAIRREDLLTAFSLSADLLLRSRLYAFAERKVLLKRNTSCEAASRRNEKKAFSAADSFFPFRLLLWGLKGASSPFLVDPARRNRWCFSGSLLARKREQLALMKKRSAPRTGARTSSKKKPALPSGPRGAQAFIVSPLPSAPDSRAEYAAAPYSPP